MWPGPLPARSVCRKAHAWRGKCNVLHYNNAASGRWLVQRFVVFPRPNSGSQQSKGGLPITLVIGRLCRRAPRCVARPPYASAGEAHMQFRWLALFASHRVCCLQLPPALPLPLQPSVRLPLATRHRSWTAWSSQSINRRAATLEDTRHRQLKSSSWGQLLRRRCQRRNAGADEVA